MPLLRGSSNSVVGQNVKELMQSGREQKQAVAIALQKAGKSNKKGSKRTAHSKGSSKSNEDQIGTKV